MDIKKKRRKPQGLLRYIWPARESDAYILFPNVSFPQYSTHHTDKEASAGNGGVGAVSHL